MKNRLSNSTITLQDKDLFGGVKFSQDINPDKDFMYGCVSVGEIRFTIDDSNGNADSYLGELLEWNCKMSDDTDYQYKGSFIVSDIKKNRKKATITASDKVSKLDRNIDSWLTGISFPTTLGALAASLASYCGLTMKPLTTAQRSNFIINNNFIGKNITGRQMMEFIAQTATSFCVADNSKSYDIKLEKYIQSDKTIDSSKYISLEVSDFFTMPIQKVQIQSTFDDIGYIAGDGDNAYVITENTLFFTATSLQQNYDIASSILDELDGITYTPMKFSTFSDFGIDCGDIITVNSLTCYVMSKTITESGCKFECKGNRYRDTQKADVHSAITVLNNKTNELIRTVDETTSKITEVTGQMKTVQDDITGVETQIATIKTDVSEVKQTADGLTSSVSSITATLEDLDGDITVLEEKYTNIEQTVGGIDIEIGEMKDTTDSLTEKTNSIEITVNGMTADIESAVTKADSAVTKTAEFEADIDGLRASITKVEEKADSNTTKTLEIEADLNGFSSELTSVKETNAELTTKTSSLEQTINGLSVEVSSVTEKANSTEEKVAEVELSLNGLDTRISEAKTTADGASQKANELEITVDGYDTRITSAENTATSAVTKANELEVTVDGFDARITAAKTTADGASQKATEVKATVDGLSLSTTTSASGNETTSTISLKSGTTLIDNTTVIGTTKTQAASIAASAVNGITLSTSTSTLSNETTTTLTLKNGTTTITSGTVTGVTKSSVSSIVADAVNGITLTTSVNGNTATLTLKNGTTTITSGTIKFEGLVTFTDLSTSGKTTIHGANITTGTISADRIDTSGLWVEKIYQGSNSKCVIDCSTSNYIYIGGNSSTTTVSNLYLRASSQILIGRYGDSSGFIFNTSGSDYSFYCGLSTLANLGTSSKPWGDLYASSFTFKGSSSTYLYSNLKTNDFQILPGSSVYVYVGTSTYPIYCGYFTNLYVGGTKITAGSSSVSTLTSGNYTVTLSSTTLQPKASNTYSLGSSSYYWKQIHAYSVLLYYSSYKYATLTCNSSGKLCVGGTAIH